MATFIGTEALTTLARSIAPEIAMSAYYSRKALFDKMGITLVSGIQFKNIRYVLLRKGHTTRRKVVGSTLESKAGKLLERELVTYLTWNRYRDNQDSYREYPLVDETTGDVSYPGSELALRAVLANYADDIYDCVWHGDSSIEIQEQGYLGLFDGFYTNARKDIEKGFVNPIHLSGVITQPTDSSDAQAWHLFKEFVSKLDPRLRSASKVIIATNTDTAENIADGYGNSKNNNKEAVVLENGNYTFPNFPNIELAHDPSLGIGSKLIAYTVGNMEYGVDTENPENSIDVQFGSDTDAKDIFFQPQSAQGTRIVNPVYFACTDAPMSPVSLSGDPDLATYAVVSSNTEYGTVKVNGSPANNDEEYAAGTTLKLKAEATVAGEFVKWSNGQTATEITVITSGRAEAMTALFKKKATE